MYLLSGKRGSEDTLKGRNTNNTNHTIVEYSQYVPTLSSIEKRDRKPDITDKLGRTEDIEAEFKYYKTGM